MAETNNNTNPQPQAPQAPQIDNTKLVEAMQNFKATMASKETTVEQKKNAESTFLRNVVMARYFVPVIFEQPNEPIQAQPGEKVKIRMHFQMVKNGKGQSFVPAFTSTAELSKNRKAGEQVQVAILTAKDLQNMLNQNQQCAGFAIDPFGENLTLITEHVNRLMEIHEKNMKAFQEAQKEAQKQNLINDVQAQVAMELNSREQELEAKIKAQNDSFLQSFTEGQEAKESGAETEAKKVEINDNPEEMLDAIGRCLKKNKVNKAYCKVCHGVDAHYVIVLDGKAALSEIESDIQAAAADFLEEGIRLELTTADSDSGQKIAKTEKPFYKKSFF